MDDPAGRGTAKTCGETFGAVGGFNLNAEGTKHVDAPGGSGVFVLFETGHGVSYGGVDEPRGAPC